MKEALVIPCYNEQDRLVLARARELLARESLSLVFVDDGSTDGTARILQEFRQLGQGRILVETMPQNSGKAEAVRRGLLLALELTAGVVGYADADFATPPSELIRLLSTLHERDLDVVFGARVALMGSRIQRSPTRHFLGRVFATAASLTLREQIHDTQCGAKWFRRTEPLIRALGSPFETGWAFDVELLGRLLGVWGEPRLDRGRVLEIPLEEWTDVPESKVKLGGMLGSLVDLGRLWARRQK